MELLQNLQNKTYYYKIYGLILKSPFKFSELVEIEKNINKDVDVTIQISIIDKRITSNLEKGIDHSFEENDSWFSVKETAIYHVKNGNEIIVEPKCTDINKIKCFILGSAFGIILIQRKIVAIHGGTILINNKGIIITGKMGAGKSTLTSGLRLKGYKFLADDVSVITKESNSIFVNPAYPQQKLCKDAAIKFGLNIKDLLLLDEDREKYAIPSRDKFHLNKSKLNCIFEILVNDNEINKSVVVEEVMGVEKLNRIIDNIYRVEIAKKIGIKGKYFVNILDIAKDIKYFKILRPKGVFSINEQINLIEELC